jgi:hypothetical protein
MAETWKKVAYYDEVATTFTGLSDTPANYTDAGSKLVRVNATPDALEFITQATLKLDDFGAPDDTTDLDATDSLHGLMSKTDKGKLDAIEAAADVTDATNVDNAGAVMEADFDAKGDLMTATADDTPSILSIGTDNYILCVSTDTPAWDSPATVAATMALDDIGVPDAAVDINDQQLTDAVAHNSSATPDPVLGKYYYDTDDDHLYVCTSTP